MLEGNADPARFEGSVTIAAIDTARALVLPRLPAQPGMPGDDPQSGWRRARARAGHPNVNRSTDPRALLQMLQPMPDSTFSEQNYGFQPGRRAHDAVLSAQAYVHSGRRFLVDVDLDTPRTTRAWRAAGRGTTCGGQIPMVVAQ